MNTIRELKQQEKYNNMLKRKNKEIERLQKELDKTRLSELNKEYIINELEKWLKDEKEASIFDYHFAIEDVLDKLQELKEVAKNDRSKL